MNNKTAIQELMEIVEMDANNGVEISMGVFYKMLQDGLKKERQQMIDLVQSLKDYTSESHNILGHDEREASEFVDIFLNQTYQNNQ